jgi:hypothetical protein
MVQPWQNPQGAKMHPLAAKIRQELKIANQCGVYENELARVWPRDSKKREAAIEKFAKGHGWRVRYPKEKFVAIFDEEPPFERN